MQRRFPTLLMAIVLISAAGCTPPAAAAVAPTRLSRPATGASSGKTITVLAAASLTESFGQIGKIFQTEHPGVKVAFSFAGSQQLVQQLGQGVPAEVFASASDAYMDAAVKAGRVDPAAVKTFARNKLTVIYPAANPAHLKTLQDLARPGIKLVLGDQSVPAGQYSLAFLKKASQDGGFGPGYQAAVLKNVVSYEDNVESVLAKVSLGEADAGIVYTTDAATVPDKVGQIEIPDALNVIASYPLAAIKDSASPDLAQAFVDLVAGPEGQAVLTKAGFIPPG